mgnify:CR=1 FL=1
MEFISTYFELIVVVELALIVIGLPIVSSEIRSALGLVASAVFGLDARLLNKIDDIAKDLAQKRHNEDAEY